MKNEYYNLLKEVFPNLPKDRRTFDKKKLDDPLLFFLIHYIEV